MRRANPIKVQIGNVKKAFSLNETKARPKGRSDPWIAASLTRIFQYAVESRGSLVGKIINPSRELSFHPVSLKGTMKVTTSFKYVEKRLL